MVALKTHQSLNLKQTFMSFFRGNLSNFQMIESECQPENQSMCSASRINRSPLRNRNNPKSITQTAPRIPNASLSPLRTRKDLSYSKNYENCSDISNICINNHQLQTKTTTKQHNAPRASLSQKNQKTFGCFKHDAKVAEYYVIAGEELMYCCQKCAILLASQSFNVVKLGEEPEQTQNDRRQSEIEKFMTDLEVARKTIVKKKQVLDPVLANGEKELNEELKKVEDYYNQFYQILDEHKQRVVRQIKEEYQSNNQKNLEFSKCFREAIDDIDEMNKDILQSMNEILFQASEEEYRPVMNAYQQKLGAFQTMSSQVEEISDIVVRKIVFKDAEYACQALQKGLQVEWEEQVPIPGNVQQNQSLTNNEQLDAPSENLVECVQNQEKMKSSLKNLGGLFCSFDE